MGRESLEGSVPSVSWLGPLEDREFTHAKPDVDLLDLLDLALGVQRVGQLERRLERLGLLLRGASTWQSALRAVTRMSQYMGREGTRGRASEARKSAAHLLADEEVHHLDGALQLGHLVLEPCPPLQTRLLHELVLAVSSARPSAGVSSRVVEGGGGEGEGETHASVSCSVLSATSASPSGPPTNSVTSSCCVDALGGSACAGGQERVQRTRKTALGTPRGLVSSGLTVLGAGGAGAFEVDMAPWV